MAYPTPNLAGNKKLRDRVIAEFLPLTRRVRDDRQGLREIWQRHYRLDRNRNVEAMYHGRVKIDYKLVFRIRENWVKKLKAELFPETKRWVGITALRPSAQPDVEVLESLYRTYIHRYIQLRRLAGPWLRQHTLYGTSVVDLGWMLDEQQIMVPEDKRPHGRAKVGYKPQQLLNYIGPTLRLVDLFLWYIWPTDVDRPEHAVTCFEDQLMEQSEFKRLGETPIDPDDKDAGTQLLFTDKALATLPSGGTSSDRADQDRYRAEIERLAQRGLAHRSNDEMEAAKDRPIDLCRGYWKVALEDGPPRWYWVAIAGDETVCAIRRSPWNYNGPSYLASRFLPMPHEFYGYSVPWIIETMAPFLNDILNQTGDALVWSLNPMAAIDPSMVQDLETIKHRPGGRWMVRNPREAVQFFDPPKESASFGMQAAQGIIGLANDEANVSPYGGAGLGASRARGRAVQTATGVSVVAGEAQMDIADPRQVLEDEALVPFLHRTYRLSQQFLDRDLILRVEGVRGVELVERRIGREDLVGDFDFDWISQSSTKNPQVRSQQSVNLLQMASRIPPEMMAQEGKRISLAGLVEIIAEDMLGIWESQRVVVPVSPGPPALDPEIENDLFLANRSLEVLVNPQDNDQQHLQVHQQILRDPRLSIAVGLAVQNHLQQHQMAMQAKQMMAQMQAQQQLMAMQGGAPPGPGGPGAPPGLAPPGGAPTNGGPQAPQMNPGRPAQTNDMADVMRGMPRDGAGGM